MRSKKKSIAVLSAMLALVLAVQVFAFTAAKFGDSKAEDSVKVGVTRRVMDAKPENKTTVVRVRQSVNAPGGCTECYLNEAGNGVYCTAGC